MFKQWFDKRAEDGNDWTISLKVEQNYTAYQWQEKIYVGYEVVRYIKARPSDAKKYGKMKQEEAIAMAKLLNATIETESAT